MLALSMTLAIMGFAKAEPVSFRLDVMPVFMKHGCNNGSCHGAARGKDGFMLSLFGYDPAGDYYRITRQVIGRRIDLAVPEKSMLLEKVIGAVPHTGGKLFDTNHADYKTLLAWLKAGAPMMPRTRRSRRAWNCCPERSSSLGPASRKK